MQTGSLLLGRGGDLADQTVDVSDLGDDLAQGLAGLADQIDAGLDLVGGRRDQALDLLGGLGRALGERPDLGGDDREALAGIAGPGRLDPGVQRQQIGLESDLVDHADDLADLGGGVLDLAHGRDGAVDDVSRPLCALAGVGHQAGRVLGARSGAADGSGDLVQRGGGLFEAGGLLLSATRQVVGGQRDLVGAVAHAAGRAADGAQGVLQASGRAVEIFLQLGGLRSDRRGDAVGQVAGRQA